MTASKARRITALIVVSGALLAGTVGRGAGVMRLPQEPGLWTDVSEGGLRPSTTIRLTGNRYRTVGLDIARLNAILARAPYETSIPGAAANRETGVVLELPWPAGGTRSFRIEESPVMAPELAAKFPELKTYRGQGIDDPAATLRFDWVPSGFHGMVLSPEGTVYIDPYSPGDRAHYRSYFYRDYERTDARFREDIPEEAAQFAREIPIDLNQPAHGTQLRTYRLAMAATGEYTAFYGGTVNGAMAGIVTTVNRVNTIYEKDLAVHMNLVANNDLIVYTNAATDPYTNSDGSAMLSQNQTNLTSVIGTANFDIGHVFSTGGGGIATLQSVCNATLKARGVTGNSSPIGDGFDVDYVAHEVGHQFGGTHTFNGTTGSCSGSNRTAGTAYEPGSGSTIQAYAGICGAENLQAHSDPYFHAGSQTQMIAFITNAGTGGSCAAVTATNNTPPTVNAGADFTIPQGTPFTLTASGGDVDGDTLTYTWEEFDLGTAGPPNTDDGSRPIFRSFNPTTSPVRTLPQLSSIINNTPVFGESLPTTTRALTFRVTARDNRAGGGGTASDDMVVNVNSGAGPFVVTAPNTAVSWTAGTSQSVTWNVANTSASPVNAANVKISLSTDGGLTYPTVIAASTPNDGTESITVPNVVTTTARIKVEAVGNIFFDISNANFTILASGTPGNFAKVSPTSGATGQATSVSLSWLASSSATGYGVCVDTINNNVCDTSFVGVGNVTSFAPPGLTTGTTYYWQVQATNAVGTTYADGSAASFWSFTTVAGPGSATYNAQLMVPACGTPGNSCDSGVLLDGRGPLGPEVNAPNNLYGACTDQTLGVYHSDESIDRIKIFTTDASPFAPGKQVTVEATVWLFDDGLDFVDFYYTGNVVTPSWTLIGSIQPSAGGGQRVVTTNYVLPAGGQQAVRVHLRYGGSATTCTPVQNSGFDESDDVAFVTSAVSKPFDFTGDAKSDILWRHSNNGQVWLWPMNGSTLVSQSFVRTVADTNYEIRGMGDQNGDGKADILWRNKITGALYHWPMNGASVGSETFITSVDPAYDIVGSGDYNGDGKSDILWRHGTNGQVWIWLMNGASILSSVLVDTVDPIFRIDGSGDLDADGKSDIIWRNTVNGDVWVWLMNGTTRLSQTKVGGVPDLNYQIQGVADFTGDGKADILWRHGTQGHLWVWPMNGAVLVSQSFVATVDPIYTIRGFGDYNGDGKADIVWHHNTVGDVWVWLMNGAVMTSQTLIGQVPDTGYQIVKVK
ncbi:MAG TPA: zinc-dependent metalloprotease family protein [Vicinamibacterales bacterium]|nr:zinc-dependent metalloprotease family protein [Vicinamibacterales bacterium]